MDGKKDLTSNQWKGTWRDDWRIMGQEGYLLNQKLQYRRFDRAICVEDYVQCEFCQAIFDEDKSNPSMAYFSPVEKVWVCKTCFHDFCMHFNWDVDESSTNWIASTSDLE